MSYYIVLYNWVELGNGMLINMVCCEDLLGIMVVIIMAGGSLIVTLFVYVEM